MEEVVVLMLMVMEEVITKIWTLAVVGGRRMKRW